MYNNAQLKAINATEDKIIIKAAAGTGKTHTLIGIANKHQLPSTVLITFTNRAAEEMKSRLKFDVDYVGTIHSFAKRELTKLAKKHNFRLRILKNTQIRAIIKSVFKENDFGIYVSDRLLLEFYQFLVNDSVEFGAHKLKIFYEAKKAYQLRKKESKLYDNTDTPLYLLEKLNHYNERLNFDLILVDEAQDLDSIQYELIQLLGKKVVAIGDPEQSIYLFRGATPEVFNRFIDDGYALYKLDINYRSKQEILDYLKKDDIICVRGTGGQVIEDDAILKYAPMILCRSNAEVDEIKKYYPNVMTIHAAKGLEFNNVLVVHFLEMGPEDVNVKYVALTRARDRLAYLPMHKFINKLKGEINEYL